MTARDKREHERSSFIIQICERCQEYIDSHDYIQDLLSRLLKSMFDFIIKGYNKNPNDEIETFFNELYVDIEKFSVSPAEIRYLVSCIYQSLPSSILTDVDSQLLRLEQIDPHKYFGTENPIKELEDPYEL